MKKKITNWLPQTWQRTMKTIAGSIALLGLAYTSSGQCNWPASGVSLYGTGTTNNATCIPVTTGIQVCHFFTEYARFNSLVVGQTYTIEVTNTDVTSPAGPYTLGVYTAATSGTAPLATATNATFPISVTFVATGTSVFTKSFTAGCGNTGSNCNYFTIQNTTAPAPTATTNQPSTATVGGGITNAQILRVDIPTCSAGTLTDITFGTTGSTNPSTDISAAKVYYTTSTTFSTTTQFGTTIANPNGSFTVTGSQAIPTGIGYFWLVYDVACGAVAANLLDAEVTGYTLNSVANTISAPTNNPTGTRTITSAYTATTSQPSTLFVSPGSSNQQVLSIALTGCVPTSMVSSINFTTTGTTSAATDITNAMVYFTPTTTFATTTPFGTAVANPNGSFTVNGSQVLGAITGYFWLTYDIAPGATSGNVVDASCVNAIVDGNTATPATANPSGTRTILAPPANDNCAGAINLTVNADYACGITSSGTTEAATQSTETAPTIAASGTNDDVWYTFTATNTAHRISLTGITGGTADMAMAIYSGSCGSLTHIQSSDPEVMNVTGLTPGALYTVRVYTYTATATTASFTICIGTPPPPPANDNCAGAVSLTVNPDYSCGFTNNGTTVSATQSTETAPTVAPTGTNDDVWYTFTATGTAHRVSLTGITGGTTDMAMAIYSGSCGSLTHIQSSDPEEMNLTGLTPGTIYTVRVYTYTSTVTTSASFTICIGTPPPPPANDNCAGAIALTVNPDYSCGSTTNGTTVSATQSTETAPTVAPTGTNDDVWYTFTATNASHRVSLTNVSGSTDMAMAIYNGSCGSLTHIQSSDPNDMNVTGLTPGTIYTVRVYTYTATVTTTASFNICVGTPPPPPANDACANAISLNSGSVINGSTVSATQSISANLCEGATSTTANDVWYSAVASSNGSFTVSATVTSGDIVLSAYGACDDAASLITCADAFTAGTEVVTIPSAIAGNTYYFRVFRYNSAEGLPFTIQASGAPLPVKLASFTGKNAGTINVLNWKTTEEKNFSHFELQRSNDGVRYSKIATVTSNKNEMGSEYAHNDESPFDGKNFYRLNMVDIDGRSVTSEVVELMVKAGTGLSVNVYPNPVSQQLNVEVAGKIDGTGKVIVTDIVGKTVRNITMTGNTATVDMSNLSSGIYMIKYSDNSYSSVMKITKD